MSLQDKENPSAPQIPVNNRLSFSKIPTFRKYSNNKKLKGNIAVSQTAKNSLKQFNLRGESGHQVWYFNVIKKGERIVLSILRWVDFYAGAFRNGYLSRSQTLLS